MLQSDQDINASEVRRFLHNKHELAYCYLLTVGAKALVLCGEENIPNDVLKSGVNNESLIKQRITLDEVSTSLQSRLRDGTGIEVYKRNRSNSSKRKIIMKIKEVKPSLLEPGGEYLVWDSSWTNRRIKFALGTLLSAELVHLNVSSPVAPVPTSTTTSTSTATSFTDHDTVNQEYYIRLVNKERSVELLFPNMLESEAFLFYCTSIIHI